ncbi:MAG TPA: UDP-N-acetylmuramate dehydrogenase [Anaerolineales bacterium]|nr:UDP-N-acetylmuramate dehydrogenase [Anaerolineales bacterium]
MPATTSLESLRDEFDDRIAFGVPLRRYTAARIGGPAEALLTVESVAELSRAAGFLWDAGLPFRLLGAGSNVLVSDAGLAGVVVVNKAREHRFREDGETPHVWAASGANFGALARAAAARGLSGLEWAAGIPGTIGGAVVGNAGAHGGDMAGTLVWADLLKRGRGVVRRTTAELEYGYRSSNLKRTGDATVVLAAQMRLVRDAREPIDERMNRFLVHRKQTQPPGASMGSMFVNPPGEFAGRLIDAAGLKGMRIGDAEISPLHGNFFVNRGAASAEDVLQLLDLARRTVYAKFGVRLELEIELLGEMPALSE